MGQATGLSHTGGSAVLVGIAASEWRGSAPGPQKQQPDPPVLCQSGKSNIGGQATGLSHTGGSTVPVGTTASAHWQNTCRESPAGGRCKPTRMAFKGAIRPTRDPKTPHGAGLSQLWSMFHRASSDMYSVQAQQPHKFMKFVPSHNMRHTSPSFGSTRAGPLYIFIHVGDCCACIVLYLWEIRHCNLIWA